jgi:general secretion pathway protein G
MSVKKGFSLGLGIGLGVFVAIILILVGIYFFAGFGGGLFSDNSQAKQQAAKSQMELFETALDTYRLDVGEYPTTEQGLDALRTKPSDEEKWDGPYLPKLVPKDPWDYPYTYRRTDNGEVEMISLGADGTEGGEGKNRDISSRDYDY